MSVIAFDGVCLGDGPPTGVGRSFLNGLRAYAQRGGADCVLLAPEGAAVRGGWGRGQEREVRELKGVLGFLRATDLVC